MTRLRLLWLIAPCLWSGCTGRVGDGTGLTTPPEGTSPTDPLPTEEEEVTLPPPGAGEPRLRRLDPHQLASSARDILGVRDEDVVDLLIPLDEGSIPSLLTVDRIRGGAAALTALRAHHQFVDCPLDGAGSVECATTFLETLGQKAFRRPLTPTELTWLMGVYEGARAQFGFADAIDIVTETIFQAPQFIYVYEEGKSEPGLPDGLMRLTGYELATRLSYFLWDTTPDDALLAAAAAGRLDDDAERRTEVDRLLADPRARTKLIKFVTRVMELDGTARHVSIEEAVKDPRLFPLDNPALRPAMRREIEELIGRVLDQGGSLSDLFLSKDAYVNGPLAELYGVSGGPTADDQWAWVTLPEDQRAGIATRAAFLFVYAAPDIPSPIRLGAAVWRDFFCYNFPPPPPEAADVKIIPGEAQGMSPSIRQAVENKTSPELCRGCHSKMNPAGFAFGHYDAIGQWQDEERGTTPAGMAYTAPVDASGALIGSDVEGSFDGALALSAKLAESRQVSNCFGTRVWVSAFGRKPIAGEEASLAYVQGRLAQTGSLKEAVIAIIESPGFRYLKKATP